MRSSSGGLLVIHRLKPKTREDGVRPPTPTLEQPDGRDQTTGSVSLLYLLLKTHVFHFLLESVFLLFSLFLLYNVLVIHSLPVFITESTLLLFNIRLIISEVSKTLLPF